MSDALVIVDSRQRGHDFCVRGTPAKGGIYCTVAHNDGEGDEEGGDDYCDDDYASAW